MKRTPHVALLIETSNAYCRSLLEGITAYTRDHRPWSIYLGEHQRGAPVPKWLRHWDGDGIIARIENELIAQAIVAVDVPVVNVSATDYVPTMHTVVPDEDLMAQMIFEHLRERGFEQYAFCGTAGIIWSSARQKRFATLVQKAGYPCYVAPPAKHHNSDWENEQMAIVEWIQALPKPIGVMAPHDFRGQQVIDACRRADVAVPEQVAVISIGNDELLCNLTSPPMTSLAIFPHRAGYQAASILDQLMDGKSFEPRVLVIEPRGVRTRQSTDIIALDDPNIVTALKMIRKHACDGLNVAEILEAVSISRRAFDKLFKKLVGRTAHEEILRIRLVHAKRLLVESELSLTQIAHHCGFAHTSYMSDVFRNKVGSSPGAYRKKFKVKR